MLIKMTRNRNIGIAGVTLIELIVTMFIAGIAVSGLVSAYVEGILTWRRASEKMVLYNEGTAVMSQIERFVSRSSHITTYTNVGVPSKKMDLVLPVKVGKTLFYRTAQFYYFTFDRSLRWNNMTGYYDAFNEKLLPMSNFRYRSGETPYLQIQEASFTPLDPEGSGAPAVDDCITVQIKFILNDARGDTITLSSVVTKRNTPE